MAMIIRLLSIVSADKRYSDNVTSSPALENSHTLLLYKVLVSEMAGDTHTTVHLFL
jgi:hypothetical protein